MNQTKWFILWLDTGLAVCWDPVGSSGKPWARLENVAFGGYHEGQHFLTVREKEAMARVEREGSGGGEGNVFSRRVLSADPSRD